MNIGTIIFLYNEREVIQKMIDSLKNQSDHPELVLFLGNGSDDLTWKIVERGEKTLKVEGIKICKKRIPFNIGRGGGFCLGYEEFTKIRDDIDVVVGLGVWNIPREGLIRWVKDKFEEIGINKNKLGLLPLIKTDEKGETILHYGHLICEDGRCLEFYYKKNEEEILNKEWKEKWMNNYKIGWWPCLASGAFTVNLFEKVLLDPSYSSAPCFDLFFKAHATFRLENINLPREFVYPKDIRKKFTTYRCGNNTIGHNRWGLDTISRIRTVKRYWKEMDITKLTENTTNDKKREILEFLNNHINEPYMWSENNKEKIIKNIISKLPSKPSFNGN